LFLQTEILQKQQLSWIQLFTKATLVLHREEKYSGDPESFTVTIRAYPHFKSHSERQGYPNYHWVYLKGPHKNRTDRLVRCLAFCELKGVQYIIGQRNEDVPELFGNKIQDMIKRFTIDPDRFRLIALTNVLKTAIVVHNNLDQPEPITKWLHIREK
jgi:hypothetical protein